MKALYFIKVFLLLLLLQKGLFSQNIQKELYDAYNHLSDGNYLKALEIYKKYISLPVVSDTIKNNYIYAVSKLDYNTRTPFLENYVNLFPDDLSGQFMHAFTHQEKGEYISALDIYKKLFGKQGAPDDFENNYLYCMSQLKYTEKIDYLRFYLIYNPNDIVTQLSLAYAYLENKEYDSSFVYYEKLKNKKLATSDKRVVDKNYEFLIPLLSAKEVKFVSDSSNKYSEFKDNKKSSIEERILNKFNYYRKLCGLNQVILCNELNLSSQSHANYLLKNKEEDYLQDPFKAGYIGRTPEERMKKFGYNKEKVNEGIIVSSNPVETVDLMLNAVYHRIPVLAKDLIEIGIGISHNIIVIDCGFDNTTEYQTAYCSIYPSPNQKNVQTYFKKEFPNPSPEDKAVSGLPITLQFTAGRKLFVEKYSLKDDSNNDYDCWLLTPETDKNKLLKKEIALIPKETLRNGKKFTFYINGSVDNVGFEKTWEFYTIK